MHLCEIHKEALWILVSGAVPLILLDDDYVLHLFTIVPADESAFEAFTGEHRMKALVGASVAVRQELDGAG